MTAGEHTPLLRVRDWPARFENHSTRELRTLTWIPESTDLGSDTYAWLLDHPDGAAHFGVAVGIHILAAKGVPRGYLRREDGRPHDAESIARVLRMPAPLVRDAIARLIDVGDIEIVADVEKNKSPKHKALASRTRAATSRTRAIASRNGAATRESSAPEGNGMEGKGEGRERTELQEETERESHRTEPNGTAERESHGTEPPRNCAPHGNGAGREMLRTSMARALGRVIGPGGQLLAPSEPDIDRVLTALHDRPVERFCEYIDHIGKRYKPGAPGAPGGWGWFASTARHWAQRSTPVTLENLAREIA